MRLIEFFMITLFAYCLATDPTAIQSFQTTVRSQIRFQRYSTCLPSEQVWSRTRLQCLSACFKSNYCQTITFLASQNTCYLFGDRISDGQLIADQTAETIYITGRKPFIDSPPTLSIKTTVPALWYPYSLLIGDINKDNNLDLIFAEFHGQRGELFLGDGTGQFNGSTLFNTNWHPVSVAVGDFNNDTNLDFVSVSSDYGSVKVFQGSGNGTFIIRYDYYDSNQKQYVVVNDFNGDNKLDFAVALYAANSVTLFLGNNTGGFTVKQGFLTGLGPYAMTSGKFNNDNCADLAVANFGTNLVSVLLGKVDGTFENATNYLVGNGPVAIAVGKFNGDSYPDLIVANFNDHTMSVLLGNGDGRFTTTNTFAAGSNQPRSIAVADMNRDGILDIVVGYVNNGNSKLAVLLGKCDGMFYLPTRFFSTAYAPNAVGIGDFNGDGRQDVVTANSDSHIFTIFINVGP